MATRTTFKQISWNAMINSVDKERKTTGVPVYEFGGKKNAVFVEYEGRSGIHRKRKGVK